jgi:hypothetical protein
MALMFSDRKTASCNCQGRSRKEIELIEQIPVVGSKVRFFVVMSYLTSVSTERKRRGMSIIDFAGAI